jgi:hypothetical protein
MKTSFQAPMVRIISSILSVHRWSLVPPRLKFSFTNNPHDEANPDEMFSDLPWFDQDE